VRRLSAALLLFLALSSPALAHSEARGFVLLLPTANVIIGGAIAVAASFLIAAVLPEARFRALFGWTWTLGTIPAPPKVAVSLASAALLTALVVAGFLGSRDPLANPLPLAVWTAWWGVVVLLHPVFGNLWAWLNPFSGACAVMARGGKPPLPWPERLDYVPALAIFAGFAWFQLVYPSPSDPSRLAVAVLLYAAMTLGAMLLFGAGTWLSRGDPFAVFLRQLGAAAPLFRAGERLGLRLPGAGLVQLAPLPLAGVLFILLTLSSISFDGFSNTFLWLSAWGINPLDFPGRSAMLVPNTAGLIGGFALLALLYAAAVALGPMLAGRRYALRPLLGTLVYSLIPISIAFHLAHYLTELMVNGQYALLALNDPFGMQWNVLGLEGYQVTASFLNTASGAQAIYTVQTDVIVAGHVAGVAVAHAIALEQKLPRAATLLLELPLALLMVGYTAFGLWTLSAPAIS
jgi:hypothetical protein